MTEQVAQSSTSFVCKTRPPPCNATLPAFYTKLYTVSDKWKMIAAVSPHSCFTQDPIASSEVYEMEIKHRIPQKREVPGTQVGKCDRSRTRCSFVLISALPTAHTTADCKKTFAQGSWCLFSLAPSRKGFFNGLHLWPMYTYNPVTVFALSRMLMLRKVPQPYIQKSKGFHSHPRAFSPVT